MPLLIAGVSIFAGGWLATSGNQWALFAGYAIPLGLLGNAGTFTPQLNNIQGWFERRRSTSAVVDCLGGPRRVRLRLAAGLSRAAA